MSIQDNSLFLTQVDAFVAPFYLDLLNANCCRFKNSAADSVDRVKFEASFSKALERISPENAELLLTDEGWRTQLTASWYCAIKGWKQFQNRIGTALLADRSQYASQGYCIALYSFANEESISYLLTYLDKWLNCDEVNQQATVMQALLLLDQKLGSDRAAKYTCDGGLWHKWTQSYPEHCNAGMHSLIGGLNYLCELDALPSNERNRLSQEHEKHYRHCSGCNATLSKKAKHCHHCGCIDMTV